MRRIRARRYEGDVDVFLVYYPETPNDVYCVPIEVAGAYRTYLRVEPTLNRQSQRIRWASDYKLPA